MSYRQPAFMVDNYMSSITDVAAAVLPTAQTAAISNSNKRALVDGRVGSIGQFTATGVNPGIIFDTGSVLSVAANRLIFPAGHSGFSGKDLAIYHDSVISMASPTLACLCAVSGSGVMDAVLTASSERYWQFIVYSAVVSDVFSLSGCWLGAYSRLAVSAGRDRLSRRRSGDRSRRPETHVLTHRSRRGPGKRRLHPTRFRHAVSGEVVLVLATRRRDAGAVPRSTIERRSALAGIRRTLAGASVQVLVRVPRG